MYWDNEGRYATSPEGLYFKVDLNQLIESVYVAPSAKSWYKDIIEELLNKYNLEKEVRKSGI